MQAVYRIIVQTLEDIEEFYINESTSFINMEQVVDNIREKGFTIKTFNDDLPKNVWFPPSQILMITWD